MHKPIHITTPRPTLEQMEKHYRIPKSRRKELQLIVDQFKATLPNKGEINVNTTELEKRRKRASAA